MTKGKYNPSVTSIAVFGKVDRVILPNAPVHNFLTVPPPPYPLIYYVSAIVAGIGMAALVITMLTSLT